MKFLEWILKSAGLQKKQPALFSQSKKQREEKAMWLFTGLGNPGEEYANHRHNVGFKVVEAIAGHYSSFGPFRSKFQGQISEGKISAQKLLLLKPQTYMNLSGQSVAKAAHFYKIDPERIVVFHDEVDLKPGEIRVKKGGGNAGHNGLKSIQEDLGTPDFWRVRIGVGRPSAGGDVSHHVLGNFSKAERGWLEPLLQEMARNAANLLSADPSLYARNLKPKTESEKPEKTEAAKQTKKEETKNGI